MHNRKMMVIITKIESGLTRRFIEVCCALILLLNLYVIVNTGQAEKYEVSLYTVYPTMVWVNFILIDLLLLTYIVIYQKYSKTVITILITNQLILLALPLFRGYFIYGRYDELGHLGFTKDILLTGHIGKHNFYPVLHILLLAITILANLSPNIQTVVLPMLFWVFMIVWYFGFVKAFFNEKVARISSIWWVLFPLWYWHAHMLTNMFAYTFMILLLGVALSNFQNLQKSTIQKNIVIAICLSITLVFFHPEYPIHSVIIMLMLSLLYQFMVKPHSRNYPNYVLICIMVITILFWIVWYTSFREIINVSTLFFESLTSWYQKNPYFSGYVDAAKQHEVPLVTIIKFALYQYSNNLILLTTALISLIFPKNKINFRKRQAYKIFTVLLLGYILWPIITLTAHYANFERSARLPIIFALPISSLVFLYYPTTKRRKIVFLILLGIMSYLAVFSVHMNPLQGRTNPQVSSSEFYGMSWWFEKKENMLHGYDDGEIQQWRFHQMIYGYEATIGSVNVLRPEKSLIPGHFGYDRYSTPWHLFQKPVYMIMGNAYWEASTAIASNRESTWRWRPEEYKRLKTDFNVNLVYSSVDIKIYFISSNEYNRRE